MNLKLNGTEQLPVYQFITFINFNALYNICTFADKHRNCVSFVLVVCILYAVSICELGIFIHGVRNNWFELYPNCYLNDARFSNSRIACRGSSKSVTLYAAK